MFTWDGDLLTSEETFTGEYSFLERWAYPEAPALEREVPDERYSLPIAQRVHSIVTQPRQRMHWLYEPESFIPAAQQVETYQDTKQLRTGTDAASLTTAGATTFEPRLYLIHTDHLGTPQELTDSDGTLHWSGQYRAWGELQKATDGQSNAADVDMRLRFQGQYHDEETGLHYNRFRYYDPRVGRFTTQDPISLAGWDQSVSVRAQSGRVGGSIGAI